MVLVVLHVLRVIVTDISRQCQPEKLIALLPDRDLIPVSHAHNDEQSSASGQDYASYRSAIGVVMGICVNDEHIMSCCIWLSIPGYMIFSLCELGRL